MALKPENVELFAKIEYGLKLAIQKLYEKKAANNAPAVFIINGEVKHIPAREILENHKKGIWIDGK